MNKSKLTGCLLMVNFLNGLVFYAPVSLLVRTQMGITVSQIFWLQAILSLSCLVFEIPAGFFSDRFGYRKTWVLSQGLMVLARVLLLKAGSFPAFVVEAVVEGLSYSLLSGADSAYLYSWYQGEDYALLTSKAGRAGTLGFLVSTVLYALMLPLLGVTGLVAATCISTFLGFLLLWTLPQEPQRASREPNAFVKLPGSAGGFFLILSVYSIAGLVMNFFYAVKVERVGLPYEAMTPIILGYSALNLLAPKLIERLKEAQYRRACCLCLGLVAVSFLGMFLWDGPGVLLLMVALPLPLTIFATLLDEILNRCIDRWGLEENRATVLSIMNMGNNVLEILFLCGSALLAGNEGNVTFLFAAVFLGIALLAMGLMKDTK